MSLSCVLNVLGAAVSAASVSRIIAVVVGATLYLVLEAAGVPVLTPHDADRWARAARGHAAHPDFGT